MTAALRTGEVASLAGVNRQTLRYYERRGLLDKPDRTLGGHRVYPPETVTTLRVIKAAQRLGFKLDEVAELLETGRHATGLQDQARTKLSEVEDRIADLTVLANTLRTALDVGCDDLIACSGTPRCPLPFADLAAGGRNG